MRAGLFYILQSDFYNDLTMANLAKAWLKLLRNAGVLHIIRPAFQHFINSQLKRL